MATGNGKLPKAEETAQIAYAVLQQLSEENIYTTQRGVKLKLRPVPTTLVTRAAAKLVKPQAPIIPDPEDPNQFYENTAHPQYIREMQEYLNRVSDLGYNILLSHGTEFISAPEGVYGPDDDEWVEHVTDPDIMGEDIPDFPKVKGSRGRYLAWLTLYVITSGDSFGLSKAIGRLNGPPSEEDVQEALDSFRGGQGRPADPGVAAPAQSD